MIEEVCRGYDVDGVELDFLRSYPYFRETREMLPAHEDHLAMMTDLVRRVRTLADEVAAARGRPCWWPRARRIRSRMPALSASIWQPGWMKICWTCSSPAGASESRMSESFAEAVELGHQHEIPVYPCIDWGFWNHWAYLALSEERYPTHGDWLQSLRQEKKSHAIAINGWQGTLPSWRAAAANLLNAGADASTPSMASLPAPRSGTRSGRWNPWREKRSCSALISFGGESSFSSSFSSSKDSRRVAVKPGAPLRAHFQVGEDPTSSTSLHFRLHLWELTARDELRVALNGVFLDSLKPSVHLGAAPSGCWLESNVGDELVRVGNNDLEIHLDRRNEALSSDLILDGVQLEMRFD